MTTYLQRLYNAALSMPTQVATARPSQRSSSPVVAVDQRLATASYAESFALGLPAEPDPEPAAATDPDLAESLLAPARPVAPQHSEPEVVLREAPREALGSEYTALLALQPLTPPSPGAHAAPPAADLGQEAVAEPPVVVPAQSPVTSPDLRPPAQARAPEPVVPVQSPAADTATSAPSERPREEPAPAPVARPSEQIQPMPTPAAEPVTSPAPAVDRGAAPPVMRPAPPPPPEALPPPAPRTEDLDAQVRRLIRQELAANAPEPAEPRGETAATPSAAETRATRPSTAEAASVIGPLDRPARATTLYGLRLR